MSLVGEVSKGVLVRLGLGYVIEFRSGTVGIYVEVVLILVERYLIPYDKYTIELDIFKGAFEGLIYAEVEFDTLEEATSFTPPSWFGTDVTESPEYTNSYLSKKQL